MQLFCVFKVTKNTDFFVCKMSWVWESCKGLNWHLLLANAGYRGLVLATDSGDSALVSPLTLEPRESLIQLIH